ncbi:transporter [Peptoniphilus lacrimalis]|uniref:ComEA family DNA-binding protein n=1 Tax=Gardnerella TaxID=2701 RepID=UPI000C9C4F21|nr:helix-hairpin-helix domain-containing protein [Gardnerella vaginalis]MDK7189462.1 helix-hairpin-helix domain-containing protein [Bifidobacterium sp. UMB1230]PMC45459.1 transporter [Peptoniphilus lacrimalis]RDW95953.1 transporter [Gardnerella vaginalis]RDX00438.1 transporter [Gardnerella vaginalis]
MHKTSRNVLERLDAISGLNNYVSEESSDISDSYREAKDLQHEKDDLNILDYKTCVLDSETKERALAFKDIAANANSSSLNVDDFNKRNEARVKNHVRLAIKPAHVLAIMLILVVCLSCSLTMLISQYATYNKVYSYQASAKSKNHSNKQVDFYNKSDAKDDAKDDGKDESKGESKVNANHKSELNKYEESVENVSKNQDLIEKNKSEYSQNRSKNIQNKSECININSAGSDELQAIKGIGPKMAQRILDTRKKLRVFKRVEDLMQVNGIGPKTFAKIKSMICVG